MARKEQKTIRTKAQKFLEPAREALLAHQNVSDFSSKEVPEAIAKFGRVTTWRRSPQSWEQVVAGEIATAEKQLLMAQSFLDETTHVPCVLYSQVWLEYSSWTY